MTTTSTDPTPAAPSPEVAGPVVRRGPQSVLWGVVAAGVVVLFVYAQVSGATRFTETGDQYPGLFTAAATPILFFLGLLAAAITFGGLVFVMIASRPDTDGAIGHETYRAHRLLERTTLGWLAVSVVMVVLTAADRSGIEVGRVLRNQGLTDLIDASEQAKAWIVSAACALVVAVIVRVSLRWTTHVLLIVPAGIGTVALGVAGSAGQGPGHDYTTGTALVVFAAAGVLVGMSTCAAITVPTDTPESDVAQVARRLAPLGTLLAATVVVYLSVQTAILVPAGQLVDSAFGRFALIAIVAAVAALAVNGLAWRAAHAGTLDRLGVIRSSTVSAVAAIGLIAMLAVMETRTAPGLLFHDFTAFDVFLGYNLPEPPSATTILTVWRFDVVLGVGAIAAAVAYIWAVRRIRSRGIEWSRWRMLSWVLGCLSLMFVTSSGVRAYGSAMFSMHMVEHMALNMFVPVLLVLGAPMTLALRVLPTAERGALPGPREWIVWLVHSRVTTFLSHPVTALIMFVASLYIVYFTPLFGILARYHWGHELMSVHFLITGYLFYWAIIGIDPGPRRLPFLARLGLLFAVMPFHAFFGIATMTMNTVIGQQFYRFVNLSWLDSLSHDQFVGGAIAWGASEVPVVIVVIALVSQWAASDRRAGARADRQADAYPDDELAAYNAMLAELGRGRR
ncbi:cytochrome c oxidase assembly protein [Williamsia sp. CHRR-6]|uniref:cytochrome c oxidase assembly protein n=1 Tax=Williamsia sp. CHRR-6 TaxID=2835871 RepID=UPI001BDA0EE5|nr:cytochrome c oxidase assembly protein [Williamsia sp. CHRR-6]MBT0567850.1 cytochrome c oxidase assembly protein [Williamsia sp. CHRR-6]